MRPPDGSSHQRLRDRAAFSSSLNIYHISLSVCLSVSHCIGPKPSETESGGSQVRTSERPSTLMSKSPTNPQLSLFFTYLAPCLPPVSYFTHVSITLMDECFVTSPSLLFIKKHFFSLVSMPWFVTVFLHFHRSTPVAAPPFIVIDV